jgi:hypothetical protein
MLTLQFIPYNEIEGLNSPKRINKLLKIVKGDKIVLLEGRLKSHEEAELIRKTMEEIDEKFKGIELSVINPEGKDDPLFRKIKKMFINMLLGHRRGFTVIGPASLIKEIKQDPDKIQLLTQEAASKRKR